MLAVRALGGVSAGEAACVGWLVLATLVGYANDSVLLSARDVASWCATAVVFGAGLAAISAAPRAHTQGEQVGVGQRRGWRRRRVGGYQAWRMGHP
ncbi:hypothetical protein C7M71_012645 [Peterkaempfera bronchialis]|uniref:Uncharacterized protein n=1 Tax=Peterkaempfera bronchialis TaxID=2126346 RepID=A0A345SWQ8_9ACTN|nr:hypothetical protein C7M71_012645 [Peterkaempfera bronchialis]